MHSHNISPEVRRKFFKSFEAKSLRSRSFLTRIADKLTNFCGSTYFLMFHVVFFTFWILVNTGFFPFLEAYDEFPFGLLTMIVSLEAIFLAIFVLVSQNRSAYISTVRDEVHMRVNLIAEEEITKILEVLAEMRKEMGIKRRDETLEKMLDRIDTNYLERSIVDQLQRAEKPWAKQLADEFPEFLKTPVEKVHHVVTSDDKSKKA